MKEIELVYLPGCRPAFRRVLYKMRRQKEISSVLAFGSRNIVSVFCNIVVLAEGVFVGDAPLLVYDNV